MFIRHFIILPVILYNLYSVNGDDTLETYCSIYGKYPVQQISKKFLSLSIDPGVLLAGIDLSDTSLLLAKHFSPAYIRIAGPSTKFVKYRDYDENSSSEDGNNLIVTPPIWFGINEWFRLANLTPVFGISDVETTEGVWNPESTLPLLEISDKLNVSCYWMLGFDSSQKNMSQYKQDLTALKQALYTFPERRDIWKIVGSDISNFPTDNTRNILDDLKDVISAVMWEPNITENSVPEKASHLKSRNKTPIKIWTVSPKPSEPVSFSSALVWADQVGTAAKMGYDVIFRQPRLHEIFADTPVYWFSLLHKKLMGNNVLDINSLIHHSDCSIYAHCTRRQNDLERKGSLTLLLVNKNLQSYKVKIKLEHVPRSKFMEVHSYILTSSSENSTDVFLNGRHLTPEVLLEENPFPPDISMAKAKTFVSLKVPPMSIGFFVLPQARIPVCIDEEKETNSFHPQIVKEDENLLLQKKIMLPLRSRGSFGKNPTLMEVKEKIGKEIELDKKISNSKLRLMLNSLQQRIQSDSEEDQVDSSRKKYYLERDEEGKQKKLMELAKRKEELRKSIFGKTKQSDIYKQQTTELRSNYLDLTSRETEMILRERARARAAKKNVILTDDELDIIVETVRRKFLKSRYRRSAVTTENEICKNRDVMNLQPLEKPLISSQKDLSNNSSKNKGRRSIRKPRDVNMKLVNLRSLIEESRQRLEEKKSDIVGNAHNLRQNIKDRISKIKHTNRFRRDINMELLKLKTEEQDKKMGKEMKIKSKSFFKNKDVKEATIRKPGQTSDELLADLIKEIESEETLFPKKDVFADVPIPRKLDEESEEFFNKKSKKTNLFNIKPMTSQFVTIKPIKDLSKYKYRKNDSKKQNDHAPFMSSSDEYRDHLPCIYEYFESRSKLPNEKQSQKGETVASSKDSMEYLRKKRNHIDNSKENFQELGVLDYYVNRKNNALTKKTPNKDVSKEKLKMSEKDDKKNSTSDSSTQSKDKAKKLKRQKAKMIPVSLPKRKTKQSKDLCQGKFEMQNTLADQKVVENFSNKNSRTVAMKESTLSKTSSNMEAAVVESKGKHYKNKPEIVTRSKRDATDGTPEKLEEQNNSQVYKSSIKQRLQNFQQNRMKDKLQFEDAMNKLKQQRLENKKKQNQAETNKEKYKISYGNDRIDNEKIQDKLKLLKEKLTHKKKDIDKLLENDIKSGKKLKLESKSNINKQELINKEDQDSKTILSETNVNKRISDDSPQISVVKRSLFDQNWDLFGNYKPLTAGLKAWKPSDILSLKTDSNLFNAPKLKPDKNFQMFKNSIPTNKFLNFRKKRRSLQNNLNHLEADAYMNDIEKEYTFSDSRNQKQEGDYKTKIPEKDATEQAEVIIVQPVSHDFKPTPKEEPLLLGENAEAAKNSKYGMSLEDHLRVRLSDNIQKIAAKEQSVLDHFVKKISGFFTSVGDTLGQYVKGIM